MKQIGVFMRFFVIPFLVVIIASMFYFIHDLNGWNVFCIISAEFMCLFAFLVQFKYSETFIQRSIFNKKDYLMFKDIVCVKSSSLGSYGFYIENIRMPMMSINLAFQSKSKKELFEYIKKENPDCIFII